MTAFIYRLPHGHAFGAPPTSLEELSEEVWQGTGGTGITLAVYRSGVVFIDVSNCDELCTSTGKWDGEIAELAEVRAHYRAQLRHLHLLALSDSTFRHQGIVLPVTDLGPAHREQKTHGYPSPDLINFHLGMTHPFPVAGYLLPVEAQQYGVGIGAAAAGDSLDVLERLMAMPPENRFILDLHYRAAVNWLQGSMDDALLKVWTAAEQCLKQVLDHRGKRTTAKGLLDAAESAGQISTDLRTRLDRVRERRNDLLHAGVQPPRASIGKAIRAGSELIEIALEFYPRFDLLRMAAS